MQCRLPSINPKAPSSLALNIIYFYVLVCVAWLCFVCEQSKKLQGQHRQQLKEPRQSTNCYRQFAPSYIPDLPALGWVGLVE